MTLGEDGQAHYHGHAAVSAEMADGVLRRLKAPTALREQAVFLIDHHMDLLEPDKRYLRRKLGKYGESVLQDLIDLQQADFCSKGTKGEPVLFDGIRAVLSEILSEDACLTVKNLAVSGKDLLTLGFAPDPRLGACLEYLLARVQDDLLPNEKDALLTAAVQFKEEHQ